MTAQPKRMWTLKLKESVLRERSSMLVSCVAGTAAALAVALKLTDNARMSKFDKTQRLFMESA